MRWTFSNGGADRGATRSTRSAFAQSGFGLIELLIVLIVIGILMATVTPIYAKQRERSKEAVLKENGHNVRAALALYLAQGLNTTYRRSDDSPGSTREAANAAVYVSNALEVGLERGVPANNADGYANPYSARRAIVNWGSLPTGSSYDQPAVFITGASGARWSRINTYASRARLKGTLMVVWNATDHTIEIFAVGGDGRRVPGTLTTAPL